MLSLLRERRFVVLEGPPGTGKTRLAWRLADRIGTATRIQFHPTRTYEDFIVGLFPRPVGSGLAFEVRPGDLLRANRAAEGGEHVLVVDEINRADLGRVLGESILLFEAGEGDRAVHLPHVPDGYPALDGVDRVDSMLVYPNLAPEDRGRPAIATIASGRRRVRLLLVGLPFGFRSPEEREDTLASWRDLLAG